MEKLDVFTVRDLRARTGELLADAEQGRMSVVTKHGRPAFVAIPFDKRLLDLGVQRALAVRLFEEDVATLSQAARIAGLPLEDFLGVLRAAGVPAVDYAADELDAEMEIDV